MDYNDRVHEGQVLVELDTDLLAAQVAQASAQVALAAATGRQARTTLEEAQTTLRRTREVADKGVAPRSELDAAIAAAARAAAALDAALAQERASRASLTVARTNLDKATIRAPIDGVVLSRSVDAGQTVVAALQAPVLFELAASLDRMRLIVSVDEADVGRVSDGQAATFTVAAYPERTFSAKVTSVRNAARVLDNVVSYEAVLDVDNGDGLLRPGMTGTAQITTQTEVGAVTVPNAALRYHPRGAAPPEAAAALAPARVWVLRDGHPADIPVTVGVSDGNRTAIVDGDVVPGTQVITGERAGR